MPPVYYAHLAAFRGRVLRAATEGSDTASSASGLSGFTSLDVHAVTKDEMFFV